MQVSTEHLLQQAHERFAVQDYYGTIHMLDEILESGRRFADVYHLRGLALSLLGQPEKALEDFDRALAVNARYIDALVQYILASDRENPALADRFEVLHPLLLRALQKAVVVAREEAYLTAKFGEPYREFLTHTRRWL